MFGEKKEVGKQTEENIRKEEEKSGAFRAGRTLERRTECGNEGGRTAMQNLRDANGGSEESNVTKLLGDPHNGGGEVVGRGKTQ